MVAHHQVSPPPRRGPRATPSPTPARSRPRRPWPDTAARTPRAATSSISIRPATRPTPSMARPSIPPVGAACMAAVLVTRPWWPRLVVCSFTALSRLIPTVVSASIHRWRTRCAGDAARARFSVRLGSRESPASVHRPRSSARPAGRAGAAVAEPAVVVGQADPGAVRVHRSRAVAADRSRSGGAAGRGEPASGWTSLPSTNRFVERLDELAADLDDYLTGRCGIRSRSPQGAELPNGHRVLLDGVRGRRGAAELLGWPGHPGRRSPQVRLRSGSAVDRGRPLLPVGLLPPVADRRRLAARELSVAGSAGLAAAAAHRRRRRPGAGGTGDARRAPAAGPGVDRAGGPNPVAAAWIPTSRRTSTTCAASPTGCTAATRTTASSRKSWPASAGVRAIRGFTAVEGIAAPEVFHMNEGHAGFLGAGAHPRVDDRLQASISTPH